jgi:diguanylate cyclase (GGDEF)-like protein/PAS domain S-box-containing protein
VHQASGGAAAAPASTPKSPTAAAERTVPTNKGGAASVKNVLLFRWFKDVSIAKKLYFTVSIMALLIGVELFVLYFSLNTLSAVRAYVGGEGLWSKAQKDAVFHLYKYGASGNQRDYLLFKTFMQVPVGDGKARQELQQANPDMERAKQGFLEGRNHPDDIEGMIWLFRNFSNVSYIDKAIRLWGEAEPIAMQLVQISEDLHKERNSTPPSQTRINELLKSIDTINQRLTAFEDEFSYTLGEGSRWLERVVLELLLVTAITVEITGLLLAISVSRGIQRGLAEIIAAANSFARGNYSTRAKVFSRDEIGIVAKSFNHMSDELERSIFVLKQAEKKFRGLLESAPDAMIIADKDGRIKLVNAQTEKLFGCSRDYLLEQSVELLMPDRLRRPRAAGAGYFFDWAQRSSIRSARDAYCRKKNGEEFPVEINLGPLETEEGLLVSAAIRDLSERKHVIAQRIRAEKALRRACGELRLRVCELADTNQQLRYEITERERAQAELRRAFALLDQHVNNTPLGVIEWEQDDPTGEPPRVHRWSGRAQEIFGWAEREVLELSAEEFGLIYVGDAQRAADAERDLTEGRYPHNSLSLRCHTKDGQVRHCRWYNSALHPKDSGKIAILSLVEDVTEQVAALDAVYRLAHHDTLTGLPNRVMLQDRLGQALASARRRGQSVAVMMLDLDHFKNVNDALGHSIGDGLLQEVAARLGGRLRAGDTLARVGGDEFVLIQPDLIDRSDTAVVAQKLVDAFTEPFLVKGNRLDIGASIGITVFPSDATDPELLLRNADMALYRAKRGGRGQYRCYSPDMDVELKATRSLEAGLRQALERGTLELFYQPLFALGDGRIKGVEALIRWPHPDGGYVSPASFIPVAETSGVIVPPRRVDSAPGLSSGPGLEGGGLASQGCGQPLCRPAAAA